MELDEFINTELTNSLYPTDLKGLKWRPFVGKHYTDQKTKLLLVGKSHYNWGSNDAIDQLSSHDFNIESIIWNSIGINRWNSEMVPDFNKKRFQRGIERILFNGTVHEQKRVDFWKTIAFHQLIQTPMSSWEHKDDQQSRRAGWKLILELVPLLKPDIILFFSNQWKYYADFMNVAESFKYQQTTNETWGNVKNLEVRCLEYRNDKFKFKLCMIVHPSARTSDTIEQNGFLNSAIPEYMEQLKSS